MSWSHKKINIMSWISVTSLPIPLSSSSSSSFPHLTKHRKPKRHHLCKVSCHTNHDVPNEEPKASHNRRNVLIGFGGLYGASTLADNPFAIAAPTSPDLKGCGLPELPEGVPPTKCCPPKYSNIIDFKFPRPRRTPRVRPAAQYVDDTYVAKYKKALSKMKALPPDDPRSFTQQANVHCAYCNDAYHQVGFPKIDYKVHDSWLFFPFHRWYLYFYERILGSLINDPDFSIPYWNWDNPYGGMVIPSIFTDTNSPLYDPRRNVDHQPPTLVNLDYNKNKDSSQSPKQQISNNLATMYKSVVSCGKIPSLFLGSPYRAGGEPGGAGSLETVPHTPVHVWTGDPRQPHREDLGVFYSAGRDPLFYAHHANVDRMWNIWKTLPRGKRRDFTDKDWLESIFYFYDENKNLVRVKVKDSCDTKKLGYVYKDVEIPWLGEKPKPRKPKSNAKAKKKVSFAESFGVSAARAAEATSVTFPLTLNSKVTTVVKRPKLSRSTEEKEEEEEVLVIDGIEFDMEKALKFDVFINDEDEKEIKPGNSEFAGSFVSVSHSMQSNKKVKTCLRLGITDLLEDLDAEDDDTIVVTLVPKYGGPVTIQDIKIEFATE